MRGRRGRWARAVAISITGALGAGLAGCGPEAEAAPPAWPIGAAGRACQLLEDVDTELALGTVLVLAAGATVETTHTCLLTNADRPYPELLLAATPSSADKLIFNAVLTPSGATALDGLGLIAYTAARPAGTAGGVQHGPAVEVGWLSGGGWLLVVRYTFEAGAETEQIEAMRSRLVALAQQITAKLAA